jgi:GTP-binding protein
LLDISKGSGGDGSGDRSTGADGEDKFIEVPLGTVVRDKREVLFEITEDKFCLEVVRRFRKLAL